MRPMTLISLALLGLSGSAFAQEQDETTTDLGIDFEESMDGRSDRSRGNQRSSARKGGQRGGQQARGGQRG